MNSGRRRPQVQLGVNWRRFAQPQPDLNMLGTIQSGLEIGALARIADGRYVQVNGSIQQERRPGRIEAAIQRFRNDKEALPSRPAAAAQTLPMELPAEVPLDRPAPPPPTITYKRRRLATTAAESLPG